MKWSNLDLSSQECKTKQFPAIDSMKLFCALLVVVIHTSPLSSISYFLNYGLVQYVARIAVPFFFVSSGYFCFRKTTLQKFDSKAPFTYAKRVYFLYIIWTLIYLPKIIFEIYTNERGIGFGIISSILILVFSGHFHLWYLSGTAVSVVIITVALKKKIKIKTILLIGGILYIVGLLGQSYFGLLKPLEGTVIWSILKLYEMIFFTTRNGIFEGILFVGIGALFAFKRIEIKKNIAILGFIISMLLLLIEVFLVSYFDLVRENDMYLFLVPVSFFGFYCVSRIEIKSTDFTKKSRIYSSLIFYTHPWLNSIATLCTFFVGRMIGFEDLEMHSLVRFCFVLISSLIVSFLIIWLQRFKRFKWLRNLY